LFYNLNRSSQLHQQKTEEYYMPPSTKKRLIAAVLLISLFTLTYSTIASATPDRLSKRIPVNNNYDTRITVISKERKFVVIAVPFILGANEEEIYLRQQFVVTRDNPLVLPLGFGALLQRMDLHTDDEASPIPPRNIEFDVEIGLIEVPPEEIQTTRALGCGCLKLKKPRATTSNRQNNGIIRMLIALGSDGDTNCETNELLLNEILSLISTRRISLPTYPDDQADQRAIANAYEILARNRAEQITDQLQTGHTETTTITSNRWVTLQNGHTYAIPEQETQVPHGHPAPYVLARIYNSLQELSPSYFYFLIPPGGILPSAVLEDLQIDILAVNDTADNVNLIVLEPTITTLDITIQNMERIVNNHGANWQMYGQLLRSIRTLRPELATQETGQRILPRGVEIELSLITLASDRQPAPVAPATLQFSHSTATTATTTSININPSESLPSTISFIDFVAEEDERPDTPQEEPHTLRRTVQALFPLLPIAASYRQLST
jgi:hypothetical protein